jgi:acetate kinase
MNKILVLNSGSSSIKFQLFKMPEQDIICSGLLERIGFDDAKFELRIKQEKFEYELLIKDHQQGLELLSKKLLDKQFGVIDSANEINIVGHRVVHGGSHFKKTRLITKEVKNKIKSLFDIAPLHNPPNLKGIEVSETIFPQAKQVAVFDTAFHQSIPEVAYKYAIPNKFLTEYGVRVYGFHGTSHKYVSEKAIEYLGVKESKIISIHLGNGCSITAIKDGKSIDHSLGFGPVNGLVMGTRAGDIDASVIFYLNSKLGYSLDKINNLLQKQSGMLGLTGHSDLRDIEAKATKGDKDCLLALHMNAYRIKKFIGSYIAALNGLDAIIFTAGIGENSEFMRRLVCDSLDTFGIELSDEKNALRSKDIREVNTNESKVKILVIPTNEELEIAKQAFELVKN